jgi:methyltransferase (TIGR00027 family)
MRAISFFEKNPELHSDDGIAPKLLPRALQVFIQHAMTRKMSKWLLVALDGLYEYVMVRTKYIDTVGKRRFDKGYRQIVVLGADFDSRAIRFQRNKSGVRWFEPDALCTQKAKCEQFRKRRIEYSPNVHFIPIDFTKEALTGKLKNSGFEPKKETLFIMEGIPMYLDSESINRTLTALRSLTETNTQIVFDCVYSSVLKDKNTLSGERKARKLVERASEVWTFGAEIGEISKILIDNGFRMLELKNTEDLRTTYLSHNKKNIINGTHYLICAEKQ